MLATTISIALTFGTAAVVDYYKKQKDKREIVMMVMYDMCNSLRSVEKADSMLHQSMLIQKQIIQTPARYDELRFQLAQLIPTAGYTETTERIFSSSIETINTVDNVLFTENVAAFYQCRSSFKALVCDSIISAIASNSLMLSLESLVNFDFSDYAMTCIALMTSMQELYLKCQQMMDVTDEEIDAYRREHQQTAAAMNENAAMSSKMEELIQLQGEIDELREGGGE